MAHSTTTPRLARLSDAITYTSLSRSTLYRAIQADELKALKMGGSLRFEYTELDRWIETRLLSSGPRTNPWFQECGPRVIGDAEIIAYDTDLVGAYGICTDISRTYWCGSGRPRADMIYDMNLGIEHIQTNMDMLKPGLTIPDWIERSHRLPEIYQKQKYSCIAHGVGLCDEWPLVGYPDHGDAAAFDYPLEVGMTLCVEALISREGGDFSIKLEDQVLITEDGYENLTAMRHDPKMTGAV